MRLLSSTVLALLGLQTVQALPLAQDPIVDKAGYPPVQDALPPPLLPDQITEWLYRHREGLLTNAGLMGASRVIPWLFSQARHIVIEKKTTQTMRRTPEQEREDVRAMTPEERVEYRKRVAQTLQRHLELDPEEARCIVWYAYPEDGEYLQLEKAKMFVLLHEQCRQAVAKARQRRERSRQPIATQTNQEQGEKRKKNPGGGQKVSFGRISLPGLNPQDVAKSVAEYRPNIDKAALVQVLRASGSNLGRSPVPKMVTTLI
ncbi:MAG: hypothetical protein M1823_000567 [Watsoniomyces obsoletus]|nr:MAG: hypothetical protein M1823_000567 [Watsoniomyces obsoletus]